MPASKRKRHKLHAIQFASTAVGKVFRVGGEAKFAKVEALAEGETKPRIRRFDGVAYTGAAVNVGFGLPLVVDLDGMVIRSQTIPMLRGHDQNLIAGHTDAVTKTAQRVYIAGLLSGQSDVVDAIAQTADNGVPWQLSIGCSIDKLDFVDRGETVKVNGRNFDGPLYVAKQTTLAEVSFCAVGADMNTSANIAATFQGGIDMNFAAWLKAKGIDETKLDPATKAALQASFDAEQDEPAPTPAPTIDTEAEIKAARAKLAGESRRIAAIRTLCAAHPGLQMEIDDPAKPGTKTKVDIEAHAIEAGLDATATELAILRNVRAAPVLTGSHKSHETSCTKQTLQAAMMLRAGVPLDSKIFQTVEAQGMKLPDWLRAGINSDSRQKIMNDAWAYRGLSMQEMCQEAIRLDGRVAPRHSQGDGNFIRMAFSGGSLDDIFTTNVNAKLLMSYMAVDDTTRAWTTEGDAANFKTMERPRVEIGPGLTKHPRGSEAEHAAYSDKVESYKIKRFSKQFVVDEQDMIDDNFGVFNHTPMRLGEAAGWVRPDLVYALLLANPTLNATGRALFNSTDANLLTTAALQSSKLKAAITAMRLFAESGRTLNLRATHLIVPPTLEWTAAELLQSAAIVIAGTAGSVTERGTANTLSGKATFISEGRLENGVTDPDSGTAYSGSASTWFLASTETNTIEVSYLSGSGRSPVIDSWKLSEGKYGLGWSVKLDIGAAAMEWRGLIKNTA